MQPTQFQDSTTLLTYSLTTNPMPVQVSPSTTIASVASLTFVVSCPRSVGEATVAQIIIALPVDPKSGPADPTNLAEVAPLLSSASISSSGADEWIVEAGAAPGVFVFTPKTATVLVSGQSLTIEFTGIEINTVVGTALVRINEWAAKGTGTPPPVSSAPSGASSFAVAKFPYGFYAGNFTADQPMIQNGQQPTLSWTGSTNATYKILYEGNPPVDVSNLRTWSPTSTPPSPVLTHTTTFILQVSAQVEGQTATIDFNITIEVNNPSLTANDLTVLTTARLRGAVTVGQTSTPANLTLNGDLNSTGNLNPSGNVTAGGNLSATGSLTAGGTGTMPNLNVSGTVQAGTVQAAAVNSSGNSTVSGTASSGSVSTGTVSCSWVGINNGSCFAFTGNANTFHGANASSQYPTIYTTNTVAKSANWVTGIYALVASGGDWGLYTNGQVGGDGGNAMFTHLPTKRGHRVVTSPMCLEAEVHVSGNQKLSKGKARVKFERDIADMIVHSSKETYRVLLTPIGQCNGLTVIEKSKTGFVVAELAGGKSNGSFDWFIIAHKPATLGANTRQKMPAKLPQGKAAPKPRGQKKKPR